MIRRPTPGEIESAAEDALMNVLESRNLPIPDEKKTAIAWALSSRVTNHEVQAEFARLLGRPMDQDYYQRELRAAQLADAMTFKH